MKAQLLAVEKGGKYTGSRSQTHVQTLRVAPHPSGFEPKLHSRVESLSLECLDMSRAVDMNRESLDIPKFGREKLDMGRENLCFQTLKTQTLGSSMQFGSGSGCGATIADRARLLRPRRRQSNSSD